MPGNRKTLTRCSWGGRAIQTCICIITDVKSQEKCHMIIWSILKLFFLPSIWSYLITRLETRILFFGTENEVCLKWGTPTHVFSNCIIGTNIPDRTGLFFLALKFRNYKSLPSWNVPSAEDTVVPVKRNKHIWTKKQTHVFFSTNKRVTCQK